MVEATAKEVKNAQRNIKRKHPPLGLSRAGGREAPTQEEVELAGPDKGVPLSGESLCGHTPLL